MILVRVYINVLHDITFSCSLTDIQNLTFGCIKCTPYVAFTGSFLDIVFCQHVRRGMGKKFHQKCVISLSSPVFTHKSHLWCHVNFVKNERLECEIKVSLGYYFAFYQYHTQEIYQKLQYPEFLHPAVSCAFQLMNLFCL